ncbi:MAG TPA: secondary thiamine-phosphate synthase enzyme YjbQ [Ignavibacteriales bacterium]|nr:secondary thiamine-phosphate synthase enzyme YjbQ [Ignavibacteriales bacterium]HOL82215.1 secondary thiamine-phosphate synthase enzyme YjbQ [Ignavibacteriales bacterium]HOM65663.1 secondary thiamine-phosphate synthase enzyme YjbQ [Ignavibacteriales bacterium]HPD67359.1 secondary thiamine-phosphate synthase enzyme YjbQ [Ignavibacteriales bacterium]HPP32884.1 secondary thiamine-phosphate synthase enzyme YjbQ [Ignavibacteriales bacterium]
MIFQKEIVLKSRNKGFHLITNEILSNLPELKNYDKGICNLFLLHTSASLTINENCDPDVRSDLNKHFDKLAPENQPYYDHTLEGSDDIPAHIKTSLTGVSLNIPIKNGNLALGTWQGIYLCEHRYRGGNRKLLVTIIGK